MNAFKSGIVLFTFLVLLTHNLNQASATASGIINSAGMDFVLIPAGTFLMGSDSTVSEAAANEKPQHPVTISEAFYIGKFEVTQEQWQAVMGHNLYILPRTRSSWAEMLAEPGRFVAPQKPATVSWHDAQAFIQRLNEREGHSRSNSLAVISTVNVEEPGKIDGYESFNLYTTLDAEEKACWNHFCNVSSQKKVLRLKLTKTRIEP